MCHGLRAAPAQPLSHKARQQAGRPAGSPQLGGFSIPSLPAPADAQGQPRIPPRSRPSTAGSSPAPGAAGRFPGSSPRGRAVGTLRSAPRPRARGSGHFLPFCARLSGVYRPRTMRPWPSTFPGPLRAGRRAGRGFLPLSGEAPCSGTAGSSRQSSPGESQRSPRAQ